MIGSWEIKVSTSAFPQKVATALSEISEKLIGAEYKPIAYLGQQLVNGTNHAVLAEQTVLAGKDVKNIVLLIFNEKGTECNLVNIERVIEGGEALGGLKLDATTDIPEEAKQALDAVLTGFVGSTIKPIALLGTQMTKGLDYVFVAEVAPVVPDPENKVALITVNAMTNTIKFVDLLSTPINALGYAFTWLAKD